MKKSKFLQQGKVSTAFTILATFVITVFVAVMVHILSLQTPQEKLAAESKAKAKIAIAEEAQNLGISVEKYTRTRNELARDQKHIRNIQAAIAGKNDEELARLFKQRPNFDFAKHKPTLFLFIAVQKNENAFRYFLKQGVACDYKSPLGQQAFTTLLTRPYEKYFNILLEHGCDLGIEEEPIPLISAFAKSSNPERVLLYPLTEKNKQYYELAFANSIEKKRTKIALAFIEHGVDPNVIVKLRRGSYSALQISLQQKEPEVAIRLIEKGANGIYLKQGIRTRYALIIALSSKQVAVARAILEQDKNIIRREKIGDLFLSHALSQNNADLRYAAVMLAFKYGLKPSDLKNDGLNILITASRNGNYELVEQLLIIGVNPNKHLNMKMALSEAKKSRHPKADKVINLLKKHGASKNYLEVVIEERGVKDVSNCIANKEIGKIVNLDKKLETAIEKISPYKQEKIFEKKNGICLTGIAFCVNSGIGTDDCVRSLNSCNGPDNLRDPNYKTDNEPTLCCTSSFKQHYVKARCSSLSVLETIEWMDTLF